MFRVFCVPVSRLIVLAVVFIHSTTPILQMLIDSLISTVYRSQKHFQCKFNRSTTVIVTITYVTKKKKKTYDNRLILLEQFQSVLFQYQKYKYTNNFKTIFRDINKRH